MDLYIFIASIGSFVCLVTGIYVLLQDRLKTLNRLFFLMSISLAGFIFISNFCYIADNVQIIVTRYKISSFFFGTYFALNLHFNIVFTRHKLNIWQTMLLYLPAPVVIITTLKDQSLFSNFVHNGKEWDFVPAYDSFGLYFYLVYVTAYMLISIILVEMYRRKTGLNKEKHQAKIINSAYFITMTFGSIFAFLLPAFEIYRLSQSGPNTYLLYYFAIFYSVFRFKFPHLPPSIMVDKIIENIGEMILLLGTDFEIIMGNNRSVEILEISSEDLKKKSYHDIIVKDETISVINEYLKSKEKDLFISLNYTNSGENILTDTCISKVYDDFSDLTGYLVISRINNGKMIVRKAYNISDREFEVIDLILAGLSNKEIGEKLGITKRTVETHCLHIYTKLDIKDRIELFKFANEFNLIPEQ